MKRKYNSLIILCILLHFSHLKIHAQTTNDSQNFQNAIIDGAGVDIKASKNSSKDDFNFLEGNWEVQTSIPTTKNNMSSDLQEYESLAKIKKIIDGLGYVCNYKSTINEKPYEEIQLLLFDPKSKLWSIYIADGNNGKLNKQNPFIGSFDGNSGLFYALGKNTIKRIKWERIDSIKTMFTESFSHNNGNSWELKKSMVMNQFVETEDDILQKFLTIDKTIPIPEIKFDNNGELVITPSTTSSKHDFDFLTGKWKMYHKRLKERLNNNNEWEDLESMDINYGPMLNGLGNSDLYTASFNGEYFEGYTLRLFNPKSRLWSLYWVASNSGILDPPVVGSMENDIGHFFCKDAFKGQEVIVVFRWDFRDKEHPIWSQAFSPDRGKSWEWNWINVSYRVD